MNAYTPSCLGDLIRRLRRAEGLTLEQLSARAQVGVRTLGDLERHRITRPHRRTIEALIDVLGPGSGDREAIWAALRPPSSIGSAPARDTVGEPGTPPLTVGRDSEMAAFTRWFDERYNQGEVTGPIVITGLPGIGKTTLGREICRTHRSRFADGRFRLDLGGSDSRPMTTADALSHLLTRIGVPAVEIPSAEQDRVLLYRARMHTIAMIVGLDNAADEAQVRPLLVDSTHSITIVASRRPLTGLDAGHRIGLAELNPAAAREALEAMLDDPHRLVAEPVAADELVRLCCGLPLALRLVANRLASRPRMSVRGLVDRMKLPGDRLTWMAAGDVQIRTVLADQHAGLTSAQRSAVRRLSLIRTSEVSTEAAAVLLGLDLLSAEEQLEDLVDAGVLSFGSGTGRYWLNELVQIYARETGTPDEPAVPASSGDLTGQVRELRSVLNQPGRAA
ncbi:helix-turn-helix domain-containing protein [Actinoplanes solisilvae]|uniref:helix-turn-helix domain-containing protein n=1 Tax=Actinoplanes solisilvae TaxID=2486853 RepID=UPI0013E3729C|nr:helix-turn-helix domain-containing protein [Actinoplanes solisilvae]